MVWSLIISLILTIIIELTICLLIGIRGKENIKVVICANVCTNPVVVYISNIIQLFNDGYLYISVVLVLEILAVIVEFFIYKKFLNFKKFSPIIISLLCNSISFGTGLVLSYIL
jgi:hypothetical protein